MPDTKDGLRARLKRVRQELTEDYVETKSRYIAEEVLDYIDWPLIGSIHIYDSVAKWKEVDTKWLKNEVIKRWPQVKLTSGSSDVEALPPGGEFDVIVVPVLGFDKSGNRLGLGGGWYDRFLANQPSALKIGLAWAVCGVKRIPREPHDIQLDKIITETGII